MVYFGGDLGADLVRETVTATPEVEEIHLANVLITGVFLQSDSNRPPITAVAITERYYRGPKRFEFPDDPSGSYGHSKRNPTDQPMGNKGRAARETVLADELGEIRPATRRI